MKTIIIYYSQARGNTKRIADMIMNETGFQAIRIDTVVPYTGTYEEIVNQGKDEVNRGFKPEIKPLDGELSEYDRLILSYIPQVHRIQDVLLQRSDPPAACQRHGRLPDIPLLCGYGQDRVPWNLRGRRLYAGCRPDRQAD